MSGIGSRSKCGCWDADKILSLSLFLLRRWKLQVLDLQAEHQNFWRAWSGALPRGCTPVCLDLWVKSKDQTAEVPPRTGGNQPLSLIVDLNLELDDLDELQMYLFEWVHQRRRFT
jgi:hypothetical protein